jgi:hypothetical protein
LGTPVSPASPPIDYVGLAADLMPGGGRRRDVVEMVGGRVEEVLDDLKDVMTG